MASPQTRVPADAPEHPVHSARNSANVACLCRGARVVHALLLPGVGTAPIRSEISSTWKRQQHFQKMRVLRNNTTLHHACLEASRTSLLFIRGPELDVGVASKGMDNTAKCQEASIPNVSSWGESLLRAETCFEAPGLCFPPCRLISNAGYLCKSIDAQHVLVVMRPPKRREVAVATCPNLCDSERASGGAAVRKAAELAGKARQLRAC